MKNSIEAKYVYVYYLGLVDQFGWGIREDNIELFDNFLNGRGYSELIEGYLVESRHLGVLKALLDKIEEVEEMIIAIKLFSQFI